MSNKPLLTLEDFIERERRKIVSMPDAERQDYFEKIDEAVKFAEQIGMETVPLEDSLGGEDAMPYLTMENLHTVMAELEGDFSLKCRPSGNRKSKWKNKVFVSAIQEDYKKHLDQICDWFSDDSIDIYYYDEDEYDVEVYSQLVSQMNAMVIVVTEKFLKNSCRTKALDICLARKYDIPIFPIYFDGAIQTFNEQIGNLELINTREGDFLYKIRKQLNQSLANEGLFRKIKNEFSARIFLSYRKSDAVVARSLLDAIHKDERFWDVSIWYDDYLTPGEDYDDEIESQISDCDAFLLAVTPNLLKESNYVQKYEYPCARRANKFIVAIASAQVDTQELNSKYPGLPDVIAIDKVNSAIDILFEKLQGKQTSIGNDIKHKYYIALAYYWGIGVKKDTDYALKLLLDCVHSGHVPAIHFIATTPAFFECLSIEKKIEVFEFAINEMDKEFENGNYSRVNIYWSIADNLTTSYYSARKYSDEIALIGKMSTIVERISARTATVIEEKARLSFRLAMVYDVLRFDEEFSKALNDAVGNINRLMDMDIAHKPYSLYLMIRICQFKLYAKTGNKEQFESIYQEVTETYASIDEENQKRLAFEYAQFEQNYATYLFVFADNESRQQAYAAAHRAVDMFLDISGCDMAKSLISSLYGLLASQYFQDRNVNKAIEVAEDAVAFAKRGEQYNKIMAEELLAKSLFNCANICFQFDNYEKAEKYFVETIQLCLSDSQLRNMEIFRYACDYYAQLLVINERFEEAIEQYALFVNKILELQITTTRAYEYCAQFSYRVGIIALNYIENEELAAMGLNNAMAFINNLNSPSDEMLQIKKEILRIFGEE